MQGKLQQRSGDFNLRTSPFAFLFPPRMNSRLRGWGVSRLRGIAGVSVPGFCWLPFPRSGDFNLRVSPLAFLFPPRMNSRLQGWGYHGCGDGRGFGSGVFAGSLSPVAEISISACPFASSSRCLLFVFFAESYIALITPKLTPVSRSICLKDIPFSLHALITSLRLPLSNLSISVGLWTPEMLLIKSLASVSFSLTS